MNNTIKLSVFQQNSLTDVSKCSTMPFHQHKSMEISYVQEGYILVEYYSPDTQELHREYVHKHQFAIIKPDCNHRMIFPTLNETIGVEFSSTTDNIYNHLCNSNYVNALPHASDLLKSFKDLIVFTDTHNVEYQLRRFKKYTDDFNSNEYTDEIFKITMKRLLLEILQCHQSSPSAKTNLHLKKALTYINLNYNKDIKIKDVALFLNISEVYLQKMFKTDLNISVNHLINKTRIEKAEELILNTNFSLNKIARDVGYNSMQAFLLNFKKFNDCTPSQYKTNNITERHFFRKYPDM